MNQDRWRLIESLYHAALERPRKERAAYLDQACGDDRELRDEVDSLLSEAEHEDSFLSKPTLPLGMSLLADEQSESLSGQQLGPYRILQKLGQGGMGDVYLAEDPRLGRLIALKLLPVYLAEAGDSMQRFQQEARAASAISHPNVAHIYETGLEGGRRYLAMEYVEGVTLRQMLRRERIDILSALDIALQIANALAAAHKVGVIHRDIKPENIMIRGDGYVKVLDFGLAKLSEAQGRDSAPRSPSILSVDTTPGQIMGTTPYMSPEQVRGQTIDARTDIWSAGVVLYEMLTGRKPFEGETLSDISAAILLTDPPPLNTEETEGSAAGAIVSKALQKEVGKRYQTAQELARDLKRAKQDLEFDQHVSGATSTSLSAKERAVASGEARVTPGASHAPYFINRIKRDRRGAILALVIGVTAVAAVAFGLLRFTGQNRPATRPALSFQRMKVTRFTTSGKATSAAISPDGRYVAYVLSENHIPSFQHQRQSLWLRQVDTSNNTQIILPAEVEYFDLFFSRDGNFIYFARSEKNSRPALYEVAITDGVMKKLMEDVPGPVSLSPDGKRFAFTRGYAAGKTTLMIANAFDGSGEQKLATLNTDDPAVYLAWSPDGKRIACAPLRADVDPNLVEVEVSSGATRPITSHRWGFVGDLQWLPDSSGLLMTTSDRMYGPFQIWRVSYPDGEARRVTNDLSSYSGLSLTADSSTLVTVQEDFTASIWIAPNGQARSARQMGFGVGKNYDYWGFSWTPDGRIVYESTASGSQDLWIMDRNGNNQKQLTARAGENFDPSVTPDGRYIIFASTRAGRRDVNSNIWRMDIDGRQPKQLTKGKREFVPNCSPDGRWVVYTSDDGERMTLWKAPVDGGEAVQVTGEPAQWPALSPDGKLIAYWDVDEHLDTKKLAVIPSGGGEPVRTFNVPATVNSWAELRWTADGQAVTYIDTRDGISNIWKQPLDGSAPKQLTDFNADLIFRFDWSRDGRQLACSRGTVASDVIQISDFR